VAAWVGETTLESGATHFTLGADYVRRLGASGRWGIGGFGEVIFAEHSEWVFGALGSFFPTGELWLMTGLGVELFGPLTITPSVFVDLVRDQTALVWGLGIGRGF